MPEATHVPNILFMMAGVNHRARSQEEQCLEGRVCGEVKHCCFGTPTTHRHHHVAELRKGGVGEDSFDVILLYGHEGRQQCGNSSDPCDCY